MLLRIGHHSARGHAPENTLAAIERGIALHAHLVEFDVRATSDGQLVLLHDATLDRTTNGHGPIADQFWSDVKQLTGGDGQPLPLLTDALRAASGRIGAMIEIKAEGLPDRSSVPSESSSLVDPSSMPHSSTMSCSRFVVKSPWHRLWP
jgi:glycerophosphoryl diester phosphodiesterase